MVRWTLLGIVCLNVVRNMAENLLNVADNLELALEILPKSTSPQFNQIFGMHKQMYQYKYIFKAKVSHVLMKKLHC